MSAKYLVSFPFHWLKFFVSLDPNATTPNIPAPKSCHGYSKSAKFVEVWIFRPLYLKTQHCIRGSSFVQSSGYSKFRYTSHFRASYCRPKLTIRERTRCTWRVGSKLKQLVPFEFRGHCNMGRALREFVTVRWRPAFFQAAAHSNETTVWYGQQDNPATLGDSNAFYSCPIALAYVSHSLTKIPLKHEIKKSDVGAFLDYAIIYLIYAFLSLRIMFLESNDCGFTWKPSGRGYWSPSFTWRSNSHWERILPGISRFERFCTRQEIIVRQRPQAWWYFVRFLYNQISLRHASFHEGMWIASVTACCTGQGTARICSW